MNSMFVSLLLVSVTFSNISSAPAPEADAEAKPEPSDTWIVAKLPRKINYLFQLH